MKTSGEYANSVKIFDIRVSDHGKVTGMFSENRKATDYDEKSGRKIFTDKNGNKKVSQSYFFEFAFTNENADAKNLKKDDWIEIPVNGWSLSGSESYEKDGQKKYTSPTVTIWKWNYPNRNKSESKPTGRADATTGKPAKEEEMPY